MTIPFEQYVAEWERKARRRGDTQMGKEGRCTSCLRKRPKLTPDGYCHECLRYSWGYDDGEGVAVEAILAGAVKGALENSIPVVLIRRAVDEAIDAYNEECAEGMLRLVTKTAAGEVA
jgi:hypothetical protein